MFVPRPDGDAGLAEAVTRALGITGPGGATLRRLANDGGFVNASYEVRAGRDRFHLKLFGAEAVAGVRRAWDLRELLRERCRAPEQRAWLEIPAAARGGAPPELGVLSEWGLLSEWSGGVSPQRPADAPLEEIAAVLARLHDDRELATLLRDGAEPASCAEAYREAYDARFRADLELVRERRPAFVPPALVAWMAEEAERLLERVLRSACFADPASSPVHGDPWLGNVLVTPEGAWALIDWDGVRSGDPATDWAMLLGPSRQDPRSAAARLLPAIVPASTPMRERLAVLARASELDWILDPVAHWITSLDEGASDDVRADRARVHRQALAARRAGSDPPPLHEPRARGPRTRERIGAPLSGPRGGR